MKSNFKILPIFVGILLSSFYQTTLGSESEKKSTQKLIFQDSEQEDTAKSLCEIITACLYIPAYIMYEITQVNKELSAIEDAYLKESQAQNSKSKAKKTVSFAPSTKQEKFH